jgi:tetratricopeptide (TPR) repeat protein
MDYEAVLNQALDLIADGDEEKPEAMLQGIIDHVKARLDGTQADVGRYYYWGRALTAMDEPEQALLKFEKVLGLDPEHEPSLWETASIFLHDLEKPETAKLLLADKLIPMNPKNALYRESLRAAEFAVRLQKDPPSGAGTKPGPNAAKEKPGTTAAERAEREKALKEEADALLKETGKWEEEDGII